MSSHAIVIGAGIGGILTARVLRDYFDQVTVIERDRLPDAPQTRPGVPQGRHAHALLAQGQQIMEALFPGLADDFVAMGAPRMVWGQDTATLTPGGWVRRFDSGIVTNVCSRVGLEWHLRRRLLMYDNVQILQERTVQRLLTTPDQQTITGVKIESKHTRHTEDLYADLVLDASGRSSRTPQWLQELGYEPPAETIVNAHLGYATRWYAAPTHFEPDWKVLTISVRPETGLLRGGGIFQVEGGHWLAILAGTNRDYPPTDEAGFLDFARSLPTPVLYEAIKDAEPVSPVYGYRRTENRWLHYEKLARLPERLVITADAFCGFNPIYGQGMTVAALDAQALDALLRERGTAQLDGFGRESHRRLAKAVENAWLMSTGEDLRYPATEGQRPGWPTRLIQRYLDRLIRTLPRDEAAALAFMQAMNLTVAPAELLRPRIVWRVLVGSLTNQRDDTLNAPVNRPRVPLPAVMD
jgi:2-polyprenyl-6-methoxyphenol hydroxylase-like FAD-dependent oxidoreductase